MQQQLAGQSSEQWTVSTISVPIGQLPEPCSRVRTVLRILCANPVVNMCESWSRLHYTIGCGVDCSTVSSSITTNKKYDCMTTLARGVLGVLHLLSYYVVWSGQCRAVDRVCSKTVSWTLAATPHSLTSVRLLRWGYHLYSTLKRSSRPLRRKENKRKIQIRIKESLDLVSIGDWLSKFEIPCHLDMWHGR